MDDHTGKLTGNYRLIRLLGVGGFTEVYLGEHILLRTQAAIKIPNQNLLPLNEQHPFINVSVLGEQPDANNHPSTVSPLRVEDPFLWLLNKLDLVKGRRGW